MYVNTKVVKRGDPVGNFPCSKYLLYVEYQLKYMMIRYKILFSDEVLLTIEVY